MVSERLQISFVLGTLKFILLASLLMIHLETVHLAGGVVTDLIHDAC